MPIDKYIAVRKSAEIDELICRLNLITDINAAFNGNEKHIKSLTDRFNMLLGNRNDPSLNSPKDPKWAEKLRKYQR